MATWTYKIESVSIVDRWGSKHQAQEVQAFQDKLNGLGVEGWEMIGFETVPLTGAYSRDVKGYIYLCFFKRPENA
jgi:hypothetical protein